MDIQIDREYMVGRLEELIGIPSPSGFCGAVIDRCESLAKGLGYPFWRNQKGNGHILAQGREEGPCVGVMVHVDTLGAMVRSVNGDGTLRVTTLGGNMFPTLDGEYCSVHTRNGAVYSGTLVSKSPSIHVFPDAQTLERKEENMALRLDERVFSSADVAALGIDTGDIVAIEPKFQVTDSGFVKSRYLDDKASTACVFALLEAMARQNLRPRYKTIFIITTYEESGHGGSNIPADIGEVIAFDMGCVGADLKGHETKVSICPKDSGGAYDYGMTGRLIRLARELELGHAVDIFPAYGSDAGAALRAGNDVRAALIGPGVAASHGMERTHVDGMENAVRLLWAYLSE